MYFFFLNSNPLVLNHCVVKYNWNLKPLLLKTTKLYQQLFCDLIQYHSCIACELWLWLTDKDIEILLFSASFLLIICSSIGIWQSVQHGWRALLFVLLYLLILTSRIMFIISIESKLIVKKYYGLARHLSAKSDKKHFFYYLILLTR